jgi:RNA polymerase sigma factor (TIGR02999 family)
MKQSDITSLLRRWSAGERQVLGELIPLVYGPLRTVAHQRLRRAPGERSLNTTGLVHEAYLRFIASSSVSFRNREHFLAVASRVMRSVLVDLARSRTAAKRGGGGAAVVADLREEPFAGDVDLDRVAELDEALTRLEELNERQARMIEQRYFGGLSLEQIADAMQVSLATVKRDLRSARAWLAVELRDGDAA